MFTQSPHLTDVSSCSEFRSPTGDIVNDPQTLGVIRVQTRGTLVVDAVTVPSGPTPSHRGPTVAEFSSLFFDLVCTWGVPLRHVDAVVARVAAAFGVQYTPHLTRQVRQLLVCQVVLRDMDFLLRCDDQPLCLLTDTSPWTGTLAVGVHACTFVAADATLQWHPPCNRGHQIA